MGFTVHERLINAFPLIVKYKHDKNHCKDDNKYV